MGNNSRFDDAYNAQISVDADLQIIGAQHISQSANDKQEIEPTLKAIQDTAGRLPDQLSADNGYFSGDNLQALELSSTDTYITTDKGENLIKRLWRVRSVTWSRRTLPTRKQQHIYRS